MTDPTPDDLQISVLTTSFPRWPGDLCGHFIVSEIRQMPPGISFRVWAPSDAESDDRPDIIPGMTTHRFRYFFPKRWQVLTGGSGIPQNLRASRLARINLLVFFPALFWAAWRAGRRGQLIHCHWLPSAFAAVVMRPFHRRPVMVTVRGSDLMATSPLLQRLNRYVIPRVDRLLPVAGTMVEPLTRYGAARERITVLPSSMACPGDDQVATLRAQAPPASTALRLVFVGRLAHVKGVDLLLKAVAQVVDEGADVTLRLVGDGNERESLTALATELGLADRVSWAGLIPTEEVPAALAGGDVFVLSSRSEGMPYSLWEAMSMGLACIATRVGGVTELLHDGENGLSVAPESPAELAAAIMKLWESPDLRRRLAGAARDSAVELAARQATLAETIVSVYHELLAPAGSSQA